MNKKFVGRIHKCFNHGFWYICKANRGEHYKVETLNGLGCHLKKKRAWLAFKFYGSISFQHWREDARCTSDIQPVQIDKSFDNGFWSVCKTNPDEP